MFELYMYAPGIWELRQSWQLELRFKIDTHIERFER